LNANPYVTQRGSVSALPRSPAVGDQFGSFFDTFSRNVGNGNLSPLASKQHGTPTAYAARRARNENDLSFKHSRHGGLLFDPK
jgi:hypothetical protein